MHALCHIMEKCSIKCQEVKRTLQLCHALQMCCKDCNDKSEQFPREYFAPQNPHGVTQTDPTISVCPEILFTTMQDCECRALYISFNIYDQTNASWDFIQLLHQHGAEAGARNSLIAFVSNLPLFERLTFFLTQTNERLTAAYTLSKLFCGNAMLRSYSLS